MRIFYIGKVVFILVRFLFRFFAGRPMSGDRKTDATFWRPATYSLDPSHTALRWEMMRGASRLAWRLGGLYVALLLLLLILLRAASFAVTLPLLLRPSFLLLVHLSLAGVLVSSYLLRRCAREYGYSFPAVYRTEEERLRLHWVAVEGRRAWREEKVLPVAHSAALILGVGIPDREAEEWVTVPKTYRDAGGAPVEIRLPASFTGADEGVKKRLTSSVAAKLGMRSLSSSWQTEGSTPRVLFSAPPEPPELIGFSDVRRYLEACGEWEFFYGVTGAGEGFSVSITGDTPHGAVSAGSGAGKSELLKGKVMQAGHKGWFTIVLDWKEESQEWAKGLDGVRYLTTIEGIHDTCVALGEEVEWRKAHPGQPRVRMIVLAEEWSITAPLLGEYWSALRSTAEPEERRTMPARSPAITSIMKVIFAGRSLGIFLELVAIRFSARVTNGNADLRESFQVIHMARWKSQTVKMLAPDVKPFPKKPDVIGRWVAVNGDVAVVYQAPLYSDEEAREWHQTGLSIPASPWSEHYRPSQAQSAEMTSTQGDQLGLGLARMAIEGEVVNDVEAKKLTDMVKELSHLGITLDVLRNEAKRDESFPPPFGGSPNRGYTYDYQAVKVWARKRHARAQSTVKTLDKKVAWKSRAEIQIPGLYFIRCDDAIKIGIAIDIISRLSGLQVGNHLEIMLIGYIKEEKAEGRSLLEKAWHERWSHIRIRGEWFQATRELLEAIESESLQTNRSARR